MGVYLTTATINNVLLEQLKWECFGSSRMVVAGVSEAETASSSSPLLPDDLVIVGVVDYKGRSTLRSNSGGWRSAYFIIIVELAERFAYFGVSSNLISYLTGPLGQSKATAAKNVNTWSGVASLLPLLGAFVADSFLGRYHTIIVASLLYILGLGLLTLSTEFASSSSDCQTDLRNTPCSPSQFLVVVFFFSMYLMAFGQGGHKPCVQAFGADQFDDRDPKELKAKSSFFNWLYLCTCASINVAIATVSYIQEYFSWGLGFGIPCISMVLSLLVFLFGTKTYRFPIKCNDVNPFLGITVVFARAARNWRSSGPEISIDQEDELSCAHQCSKQFKFLHKALLKPADSDEGTKACTVPDVEEAKAILGLVPIWSTCSTFTIVFAQTSTFFTEQGKTMDRYIWPGFEIPAASLQVFIGFSVVFFIPIYDRIFVPLTRSLSGKHSGITTLQRIGWGLFISIISMVVAALIERRRLDTAFEFGLVDMPHVTVPMSIWWLVPQYLLCGLANVFAVVGLQEFFYDEMASDLKSIGLALYLSVFGVGSFLSSLLISVIEKIISGDGWFSDNLNRSHLDYFYWVLTGFNTGGLIVFLYSSKSYVYRVMRCKNVSLITS